MSKTCLECGARIPQMFNGGYCPKCLLKLASDGITTGKDGDGSLHCFSRELPRAFGDYEIQELLGEGGMGVVYKALQKKLNRIVALKMLRSGSLATKEELKRFQAEAQAVARLKHPNIVTVHEIGEHQGRLFFSMDCIQGRSLADIVGRTPLPPQRAARYTMLLASAIHYAHTQGVLHRDLKPGNVLVDENDQPHITDFGLAKELFTDLNMTQSGAVMGTPSYMPPEQATGCRKLMKPASDVYSLGAILYDLLTGRPPFRADTAAETLRQVIDQEPAPPRLLNAQVHRDLETICLKCLAKDLGQRYESAKLLAEDLGRFLRGEPIIARRAGALERTYSWAKRHPTASTVLMALGIMLILLGQIALFSNLDARDRLEDASRMAKGLAFDFHRIGTTVQDVASDARLIEAVTRTQHMAKEFQLDSKENPLLILLEQLLKDRPSPVVFGNWLLLNKDGEVLANYGASPGAKSLNSRSPRDYFTGVSNLTENFYISKGYMSDSDQKYKVAVIAPVLNNGRFIGALGRMVAYTELASQTERRRTALIAQMDASSGSSRYAVMWHPEQNERSATLIPEENELTKTLDRVMKGSGGEKRDNYTDPVGGGKFKGGWIASLNRVPDTPLIQVYQVRDRVRQAALTAVALILACVTGLVLWAVRNRRATRLQARLSREHTQTESTISPKELHVSSGQRQ